MGKTVRMSTRVSKSPYASRRKRARSSSMASEDTSSSGCNTQIQQRESVLAMTQNGQTVSLGTSVNIPMDREQLNQVANSVSAQIVPEIRGEIIQAVNSLRSSPAVAVSPDSIINRTSDQGTCISISSNNQSMSSVISINDQLGLNVSQQLREKIVNGEYVDLGALLANSAQDQPSCFTIDTNGQLQAQPKANKKISDLNTWFDVFLTYISIYISAHPESTQGLLKYMYTVKLGASRSTGLGWRDYDQQFRLKKSKCPALSWGTVDQELWLLYMQYVPSQSNYGTSTTYRKCFEYNNKGKCSLPHCRYLHKCLKCNNPHPAINCKVYNSTQNMSQGTYTTQGQGSNRNFRPFEGSSIQNYNRRGRNASRQLSYRGSNEAWKNPNQN